MAPVYIFPEVAKWLLAFQIENPAVPYAFKINDKTKFKVGKGYAMPVGKAH